MTVSGRRRTQSIPSFRKVTARAEAVLSDSTLPGWLFSVGWLMVPDVPENEPVTGDSPDGWRVPLHLLFQTRRMVVGGEERPLVAFLARGVLSV